jgi:hypothetical protein
MVDLTEIFDGDSQILASLQPGKSMDKAFLKTAKNIKDGIYSHDSFENLYLVDKNVMELYTETSELMII